MRLIRRRDVENLLALARIGEALVFGSNKSPALPACNNELAAALIAEHRHDVGFLFQIDEQSDRFAVAAAAR